MKRGTTVHLLLYGERAVAFSISKKGSKSATLIDSSTQPPHISDEQDINVKSNALIYQNAFKWYAEPPFSFNEQQIKHSNYNIQIKNLVMYIN